MQRDLSAELARNASSTAAGAPSTGAQIDRAPAIPPVGKPLSADGEPRVGRELELGGRRGRRPAPAGSRPWALPGTVGPGEMATLPWPATVRVILPAPFEDLDRLKPGDVVTFSFGDRHWAYRVERSFLTEPTDVGVVMRCLSNRTRYRRKADDVDDV